MPKPAPTSPPPNYGQQPKPFSTPSGYAQQAKPAPLSTPSSYAQQPRPAPFVPTSPSPMQPKPSGNYTLLSAIMSSSNDVFSSPVLAAGKPSSNFNAQPTSRSGNRVLMRGAKGSAALNSNENINQSAICYACGITIR